MSKAIDGGPAFPAGMHGKAELAGGRYEGAHVPKYEPIHAGMTLRDWFAGQALPSIHSLTITGIQAGATNFDPALTVAQIVAADCYTYADAMLAARSKAGGDQ